MIRRPTSTGRWTRMGRGLTPRPRSPGLSRCSAMNRPTYIRTRHILAINRRPWLHCDTADHSSVDRINIGPPGCVGFHSPTALRRIFEREGGVMTETDPPGLAGALAPRACGLLTVVLRASDEAVDNDGRRFLTTRKEPRLNNQTAPWPRPSTWHSSSRSRPWLPPAEWPGTDRTARSPAIHFLSSIRIWLDGRKEYQGSLVISFTDDHATKFLAKGGKRTPGRFHWSASGRGVRPARGSGLASKLEPRGRSRLAALNTSSAATPTTWPSSARSPQEFQAEAAASLT